MLLRRGSKILHIRFFLVFDAHGPCVQEIYKSSSLIAKGRPEQRLPQGTN